MSVNLESTTDSQEQILAALGKKAPEAKEKSSAAPEESEAKTQEESDISTEGDVDTDVDSQEEDETKEGEEKPKKNGLQKRINKLTKRASEAEAKAAYWESLALQKAKEAPAIKEDAPAVKTDSQAKPKPSDFENFDDYVEAIADWKITESNKKSAEKKVQEELHQSEKSKIDAHAQRIGEFKKAHQDFDEVITEFTEELGDVRVSKALEEIIVTSDMGPAVIYELAKNPALFDRINKMGALQAAKEVGKLEDQLFKANSAKEQVAVTKAPQPIKPTGVQSAKIEKDPAKMDYEEYKKWRQKNK